MTTPGDDEDFPDDDDAPTAVGDADGPYVEEETVPDESSPSAGDEFDALGFDTGFGTGPRTIGDNDETPPGGIYIGEEISILDAQMIGRALAEADGRTEDYALPDMGTLQKGLVGIDVGAAMAVVAMFNEDGKHEVVPNENNDLATPVQLFFDDDGEKLVGKEAREMAPSAPARAVLNPKAALSDPTFKVDGGEEHGGELQAVDVISVLVNRLLDDALEHSGVRPTHVVLAAPSWFEDAQKEVLKNAVEQTGATLVGIADEALAATVPYSLRLPDLKPRTALVFDHGHAALSVAVVRCEGGDISILVQQAVKDLGASRWDELLAKEAARKFEQAHGHNPLTDDDPCSELDLRLRAEDAKKALSQRAQCTLVASSKGNTFKVGFTRQAFEEAAKPLLAGSRELLNKVRKASGIAWEDLDAVIVTGGGSRTPCMRRMLRELTGHDLERGIGPEDCVAVGALYWGIGERHRQSSE